MLIMLHQQEMQLHSTAITQVLSRQPLTLIHISQLLLLVTRTGCSAVRAVNHYGFGAHMTGLIALFGVPLILVSIMLHQQEMLTPLTETTQAHLLRRVIVIAIYH